MIRKFPQRFMINLFYSRIRSLIVHESTFGSDVYQRLTSDWMMRVANPIDNSEKWMLRSNKLPSGDQPCTDNQLQDMEYVFSIEWRGEGCGVEVENDST